MKKARVVRKKESHPFRIVAICLMILVLFLGMQITSLADKAESVKKDVFDKSEAYFNAQSRYNRLKNEVNEINTSDFIERTARRDYGYCWYGETIYKVVNLAELEDAVAGGVHVYQEEDSEAAPAEDSIEENKKQSEQ